MPRREAFAPDEWIRSFAYRGLWFAAQVLFRSANVCLYLAAGLLQDSDLLKASRFRWRTYTAGEDIGNGLDDWERRIYTEAIPESGRVLLIGCGTGRDLIGLAQLGYDMTGLDLSPEAIDVARVALDRRGLKARLLTEFVELATLDSCYDAVILSSRSYSCIKGRQTRVATLLKLRAAMRHATVCSSLTPGSSTSRRDLAGRPECRSDAFRLAPRGRGQFSADTCRLGAPIEHLFRADEAASECVEAGFQVLETNLLDRRCWILAVPRQGQPSLGKALRSPGEDVADRFKSRQAARIRQT